MENRERTLCQGFVDYMTEEMSEVERKRFEHHLETCASCREDAAEWRQAWDRLSDEAPSLEPPADLKTQVMDSIFGIEETEYESVPSPERTPAAGRSRSTFRRLITGAAIAIAFVAGFGLRGLAESFGPAASEAVATPSSIERLVSLRPVEGNAAAAGSGRSPYGIACVVGSEDERRLVVYVFGSPRTEGDKVYQVWLTRDGSRSSAGTFTVDETGIGVLTVPWSDLSPGFDTVGVTLEPDRHSTEPRGVRMFRSA